MATVRARCVVNAAGVWVDAVREMDHEPGAPARPPMVAPSQGVHLVVDRAFMPGHHALHLADQGIKFFAVGKFNVLLREIQFQFDQCGKADQLIT